MLLDVFMSIIGLIILIINCATMMITFEHKHKLRFGICATIIVTLISIVYRRLTADMVFDYKGMTAFFYLFLMIWLLKGSFFQKAFTFFLQYVLTILQLYLAEAVVGIFISNENEKFTMVLFTIMMVMYAVYFFLILRFGKRFFRRLLIQGRTVEWALYSFGTMFSFIVLTISHDFPNSVLQYILLILYVFWSFCILCFAIISTHEKTKQRCEAELARNIVSTGRDHYQKMDEMYDKLRILRHDYKYHLSATREMLRCGDPDGAGQYLTDVEKLLSECELPNYCPNPVINALVASYAERCRGLNIRFDVNIYILKTLRVPNYEMCIIIGNLLENAVEACGKRSDDRTIELAAQSTATQLMLMVRNSFNGKVCHNRETLVSTKINGGIGLQSVEAVAVRHNGYLLTEWDSDMFTAYVAVRL